jgi:hypothetical protein
VVILVAALAPFAVVAIVAWLEHGRRLLLVRHLRPHVGPVEVARAVCCEDGVRELRQACCRDKSLYGAAVYRKLYRQAAAEECPELWARSQCAVASPFGGPVGESERDQALPLAGVEPPPPCAAPARAQPRRRIALVGLPAPAGRVML